MTEGLSLRISTKDDIEIIHSIYQSEIGSSWTYDDFDKKRTDTHHRIYSICINEACIGFIILQVILPEADLLNIAIHKDFQSKGYGTEVLKNITDLMKRSGVQKIFLEVRAQSAAVCFYERNGFKKIDTRKKYYNNIEDAIIMQYLV